MSLGRFVYYSAIAGGWAALLAWLAAEWLVLRGQDPVPAGSTILAAIVIGAAIAAALHLIAGMTNPQLLRHVQRIGLGSIGGAVGGALGIWLGNVLFDRLAFESSRAVGWSIMGLCIGAAEGIHRRSGRRVRNGLLGGAIGGLLGGLLFDPIARFGADGSSGAPAMVISSRATAFVILGVCIGTMIGLAHVVLKDAWLTVLDGSGPGRQLILDQTITTLGRGDHLPLPFLGPSDKDLESEHARILRQPDGQYSIEDNHSRLGTLVNAQTIQGPVPLRDGDLIRLGANIVRFNQRRRGAVVQTLPGGMVSAGARGSIPAPPPPPGLGAEALAPLPGLEPQAPASPPADANDLHRPDAAGALPPGVGPMRPPPPPPPRPRA